MARYKVFENPSNKHREKVKDGFNWVVFLFGPLWYLFNGFVGQAIGWLAVAALVGFFTLGIGTVVVWLIAGFRANKSLASKYLHQGWRLVGYEEKGVFTPIVTPDEQSSSVKSQLRDDPPTI